MASINNDDFCQTLVMALNDSTNNIQYIIYNLTHQAHQGTTNTGMKELLKDWKHKKVTLSRSNFRDLTINDTAFYYFSVTHKDEPNPGQCIFSYFLFPHDMVEGFGVLCRRKENREMIWKYLGSTV